MGGIESCMYLEDGVNTAIYLGGREMPVEGVVDVLIFIENQ